MPNSKPCLLSFTNDISAYLQSSKRPIIVTGASGWLGQAVLEMCRSARGRDFARSVTAFTSIAKTLPLRCGEYIRSDAFNNLQYLNIKNALIFHCAFLTREKSVTYGDEIYIKKNRAITGLLNSFINRNGCSGIFIPSSGAVYGTNRTIDVDIKANPYGVLKFEDERLFGGLAQRLGFPIAILRIFNLSGPFINKINSYALASIIQDASFHEAIRLNSPTPVIRSYAHVEDVVNLAMKILHHNVLVNAFDTSGEIDIELSDLAKRVLVALAKPDFPIIRPPITSGPVNHYVGNREHYLALSKQFGVQLKSLDEQIISTSSYLTAE